MISGYVLARQTAVEMPNGARSELGYTLLDGVGVFHSVEEVYEVIKDLNLPLGWVAMSVDQLLPGYMLPKENN